MAILELALKVVSFLGGAGAIAWVLERFAFLRHFVERFEREGEAVVLEVQQTYVDAQKRGRAPDSDGGVRLTDDEKAIALRLAVDKLKERVGLEAIQRALRIWGRPWMLPKFVDDYLVGRVEAWVKKVAMAQALEPPKLPSAEFAPVPTRPMRPLPPTGGGAA